MVGTHSFISCYHDDVIKWKHFPRYWPFVRGIHRFPMNSPHKGQWRRGLMFPLICVCINSWINDREAGDLRRYHAHYDVIVMYSCYIVHFATSPFSNPTCDNILRHPKASQPCQQYHKTMISIIKDIRVLVFHKDFNCLWHVSFGKF